MEKLILILALVIVVQGVVIPLAFVALEKKIDVVLTKVEALKFNIYVIEEAVDELTITTKLASGRNSGRLEEIIQKIKEQGENTQTLEYELNGLRELIYTLKNQVRG